MKNLKVLLFVPVLLLSACGKNSWLGEAKKVDIAGERISITKSYRDLEVDKNIVASNLVTLPAMENMEWSQGSGILNSVPCNISLNTNLNEKVSFNVSGDKFFHTGATPVVSKGALYALGNNGYITAFDAQTGSEIWVNKYYNEIEKKSFFDFFGSYYISGSLSISNDTLFVTGGIGDVVSLDAKTGELLWSSKLSSPSRAAPLVVDDKIVIVQTVDNKVFALEFETGDILWNHFGVGEEISILSSSAPTTNGKVLIVQYTTGDIVSLDIATGDELWIESISSPLDSAYNIGAPINVVTSPYLGNDKIIAAGNDGFMVALNPSNGDVIWRKELGVNKQFWVCGSEILALNRDDVLLAVDSKTGFVIWKVALDNKDRELQFTSPIVINSKVVVISSDGTMYSYDYQSGALLSKTPVVAGAVLSPLVVKDSLYLATVEGAIIKY